MSSKILSKKLINCRDNQSAVFLYVGPVAAYYAAVRVELHKPKPDLWPFELKNWLTRRTLQSWETVRPILVCVRLFVFELWARARHTDWGTGIARNAVYKNGRTAKKLDTKQYTVSAFSVELGQTKSGQAGHERQKKVALNISWGSEHLLGGVANSPGDKRQVINQRQPVCLLYITHNNSHSDTLTYLLTYKASTPAISRSIYPICSIHKPPRHHLTHLNAFLLFLPIRCS